MRGQFNGTLHDEASEFASNIEDYDTDEIKSANVLSVAVDDAVGRLEKALDERFENDEKQAEVVVLVDATNGIGCQR